MFCVLQLSGGGKTKRGDAGEKEIASISSHHGACSFGNKVTNKTIEVMMLK